MEPICKYLPEHPNHQSGTFSVSTSATFSVGTYNTLRSERQLVERIEFDLLFRWFVGLGIDDPVWDASTFAKNRDCFLRMDAAAELLAGVVNHPVVRRQMSKDHFSVDGTLIDAWASMQRFKPKEQPDGEFQREEQQGVDVNGVAA
jgi:transposase